MTTIALGIGSNAAVHGFVSGLLASDLPAPQAGGLDRIGPLLRAAAGSVFLIACATVASSLLSRASARSHETAMRVALGASRNQLARQLLSDSILISVAGGVFGLLLAVWTTNLVPALFYDKDASTLVFAPEVMGIVMVSVACLAITTACGLAPVLELRADRPAAILQRESTGPSRAMRRVRVALVVLQMALCCMLVIATGMLLDTFRSALATPEGRNLANAVIAKVEAQPQPSRASATSYGLTYFQNIEAAAAAVPGVTPLAWVGTLPGDRPSSQQVRIDPVGIPLRDVTLDVVPFTPASLAQLVLPPVSGRAFGGHDTPQSCRVAIINEEAAREVFAGDPLGQSIQDPAGQPVEIIGVVATRDRVTGAPGRPAIYYYAEQTAIPIESPGPARFRIPSQGPESPIAIDSNIVSNGYFAAMNWPTVAGAMFSDRQTTGGCRVAVVNEEAAARYFGGHPIGAAVIDSRGRRTEIVGVVRGAPLRTLQSEVAPTVYFPMTQDFLPRMTLILETTLASAAVPAGLYQRLDAVPGRGRAEVEVRTLDSHLSRTALAPLRIATTLVGASAGTAVVLGVLGLYGAMTDAARQRRREIAMRIALGAQGWRVIRQVVFEGARLAMLGTIAGMLGATQVASWLSRMTPGDSPVAIWVWIAAPLVLLGAVAAATVLPARRALSVDPLTIMRTGN